MADVESVGTPEIVKVIARGPQGGPGEGAADGTTLPMASPIAAPIIDTTTYDDPLNAGHKLTTLVIPAAAGDQDPGDVVILAVAVEGDAYPRWLLCSNPTAGFFFGDGTSNPGAGNSFFGRRSDGVDALLMGDVTFQGDDQRFENLPTSDPHVRYRLWQDPAAGNAIKVSQG